MNYVFRDRDDSKLNDNWIGELPSNIGKMWQIYFDTHKKKIWGIYSER